MERRDQVLIGVLDFVSLAFWILSIKCPSTNGPFLIDLPIPQKFVRYLFFIGRPSRLTKMKRLECFFFSRVRYPLASNPQGEVNCCQPPPDFDLPAPPPLG